MIHTPRLILMPVTEELLAADLAGPEQLGRALRVAVSASWPPDLYDDDAKRWTLDRLRLGEAGSEHFLGYYFVLKEAPDEHTLIGVGGFKGPPRGGRVELGYSIVGAHQRRGFATEAVRGMLEFAFAHPLVDEVIAETLASLPASIRVLRKSGFRLVGPGSEEGVIRFSISRRSWQQVAVDSPLTSAPDSFPSRAFFDAVYGGQAPWDIGAPQPDLMRVIDEHPPHGRVLDLGCGTGDLAIALTERGVPVLAVDFVDAAVETARTRARVLPPEHSALLELEVGDALRPTHWKGRIASAVDSGFYHLFPSATRRVLVRELAETLPPGGRYYLLGFAISLPVPDVPREVTREELAALFSAGEGWQILVLRAGSFRTSGFGEVPALVLCAERSAR